MDPWHQEILRKMRNAIVCDMDVMNGVIEPLIRAEVLTPEDVQKLKAESSYKARAELLLDILPGRGRKAFHEFRRGLRHQYWFLDDGIEELLNDEPDDVMDFVHSDHEYPSLPVQVPTVIREKKISELTAALEKLKPGGYLALHGMKGFGRSSLTASTLMNKELLSRSFNNQVHWITFGYENEIEDEISIHLNDLHHRVRNSDVNPNLNLKTLNCHLINRLREHFSKNEHRNALLILDDVWKKDIIEAFDFPCKTLVITTNVDILGSINRETMQLKDGFTEAESLGLFANVLGVDVKNLPPEAKRIHEECYGMPMIISMLAAEFIDFKEDMKANRSKWQFYLESLQTKDFSDRFNENVTKKLEATFKMCIQTLKPAEQLRYETLAIFSEDVNISPKTLQILWDLKRLEQVDILMLDFYRKSLVGRHYAENWPGGRHSNDRQGSYIYGIHDLLLCYLRKTMTAERLRGLHMDLVEKYRRCCEGDFSKLQDDNYSFSYIAHHLQHSGELDEIRELYFNFDFLREKIYHSGLSDLLIDLKKYESLITDENEGNKAKLDDLVKFLKSQAGKIVDHKLRGCLDLIQIGLGYSESGYVGELVRKMACEQSTKLYATCKQRVNCYTVPESLEVMTDMNVAVFFNDPNMILVGNSSDEVILWNCETNERRVFTDNPENETNEIISTVQKIITSTKNDLFLTLYKNGPVKLFNVCKGATMIQTASEKQKCWHGIHGNKICKDNSHVTISIPDEAIIDTALCEWNNQKRIGICTNAGTVGVYSINGDEVFKKKVVLAEKGVKRPEIFQWVTFSKGLLIAMSDKGILRIYSAKEDEETITESYGQLFVYEPEIEERNFVLFQSGQEKSFSGTLVIVNDRTVYHFTWSELKMGNGKRIDTIYSPKWTGRNLVNSVESLFTCAALTNDGKYLVTGDSARLVTVWTADETLIRIASFSGHVTSLDTFCLGKGNHLISGSGERVFYRWQLPLEILPVCNTMFDMAMKPWGEEDIVARKSSENTIDIWRGDSMLARTESIVGDIMELSINSEGTKVVYASPLGEPTGVDQYQQWEITLFDVQTKTSKKIFKAKTRLIKSRLLYLKFFTIDGCSGVFCFDDIGLRVWYDTSRSFLEQVHFVSFHIVDNTYVIMLMPDNTAKFWKFETTSWTAIGKLTIPVAEGDLVLYSYMTPNQKYLAIVTITGVMIIYAIGEDDDIVPPTLEMDNVLTHKFNGKITCGAFSSDSRYFAGGMDDGRIWIFDITEATLVSQLDFHHTKVRHLSWSPSSVGTSILLSASRDELTWWNFDTVFNNCRLNNNAHNFWKDKTPKYPDRNTLLLLVVPLQLACETKLCVSKDFSKVSFVDEHGDVRTLKFVEYSRDREIVAVDGNPINH